MAEVKNGSVAAAMIIIVQCSEACSLLDEVSEWHQLIIEIYKTLACWWWTVF